MFDAYILIQSDIGDAATVAELVRTLPGVLETEIVTGPYDAVARAQAHDMNELAKHVISQIQAFPGVMRTVTCPIRQPGNGAQRTLTWTDIAEQTAPLGQT